MNEEYKVIFFQVAKAASTDEWKRFFTRLQKGNKSNWFNSSTGQGTTHLPDVSRLKRLSDYSLDEA